MWLLGITMWLEQTETCPHGSIPADRSPANQPTTAPLVPPRQTRGINGGKASIELAQRGVSAVSKVAVLFVQSDTDDADHLRREVGAFPSMETSRSHLDLILGNLLWVALPEQGGDDLQRPFSASGRLGFCDDGCWRGTLHQGQGVMGSN